MENLAKSKAGMLLVAVAMAVAMAAAMVVGMAVAPPKAHAVAYDRIADYTAFMEDADIYINRSKVNWGSATVTTNTAQNVVFKENMWTYRSILVDGVYVYRRTTDEPKDKYIMYTGDATGSITIPNAYTVRYSKAAVTADGEVCDLIVKCTSLTLDANTERNQANGVDRITMPGSAGTILFDIWGHGTGDQAYEADPAHPGYYKRAVPYTSTRVAQSMQVYCVKTGTDTRVEGRFTMYFFDLDTVDSTVVPWAYNTIWSESVQLRNGYEAVAISSNTVLDTSRAAADGIFMAAAGTENLESNPSTWDSGVVVRSDSNGLLAYTWRSGSHQINTSLGFGMPGTVLGGFSFQKLDADFNAFGSQGNGNLSSVRFDVFRDEACTQRVMTMTVEADGTVTTGKGVLDLANNPYYVKEVSATGYNVNATPFMMVATKNGG